MKLTLPLRAIAPGECAQYPYGRPAEMAEADYEPHEVELLRKLAEARPGTREYEEEAANCAHVLHELKVLFPGSRIATPEEENKALRARAGAAPSPARRRPRPELVQTTMLPPEGTTALKLPTKVRENLGYVEPEAGEDVAPF